MATASPWQRPFPPDSCDVAVIGAGIIGASTAYALSRLDRRAEIVLLDRAEVGAGASGRNAGFLMPGTHDDFARAVDTFGRDVASSIWHFTMENIDMVRRVDPAVTAYRPTGSLLATASQDEGARLERAAELLEKEGEACVFLDAFRVNRRLSSEGFVAGLANTAGGTINPIKLVNYLAESSNATVLERWPVTALEAAGDGVRVSGPGGTFVAGRVVLCANAFLPQLIPSMARYVRPVRGQMLATEPLDPFLQVPLYSDDGFYYVRQRIDGRLLVGGARHLHEGQEIGYEDVVTDALQNDLEAYLNRHFPALGRPAIDRRWSGTMGFSPDGLPVIGTVDGLPGALFACGFTGHGMGFGLRFGLMMARLALGREDDCANLFSKDRPMPERGIS
jgi:gamma-glutamylputrescine oxidase